MMLLNLGVLTLPNVCSMLAVDGLRICEPRSIDITLLSCTSFLNSKIYRNSLRSKSILEESKEAKRSSVFGLPWVELGASFALSMG